MTNDKDQFDLLKIDTRDATWFTTTLVELKITSSRGPDRQLQRQQSVYRQLGVQQALVLFQINRKRSRFYASLLKNIILDPFGQINLHKLTSLTYLLLVF